MVCASIWDFLNIADQNTNTYDKVTMYTLYHLLKIVHVIQFDDASTIILHSKLPKLYLDTLCKSSKSYSITQIYNI